MASLQGNGPAPVPAAPPGQNSQSILDALANLARQNTSIAPSTSSVPAPAASYNVPPGASGLPYPVSSVSQPHTQSQPQPLASYPPSAQPPVNLPGSLPFPIPQMPGNLPGPPPNPSTQPALPFTGAPGAPGNAGLDAQQQQQILLIKALADQGVPFDKIPALLQGLSGPGGAGAQGQHAPVPAPQNSYASGQPSWGAPAPKPEELRDRRGHNDGVNSPGYHQRSRSRSPDRGWGNRGSPHDGRGRRDYGRNSPPRGRDGDRDRGGRRGADYRDRSPARRRGQSPPPPAEKWTDLDPNLPSGTIKVLSRTLFVGGVTLVSALAITGCDI